MPKDETPEKMPEKLREILSEPGWIKSKDGVQFWRYELPAPAINVNVEIGPPGISQYAVSDGTIHMPWDIMAAADLMRRIQAAIGEDDDAPAT